jgi:hypothetical protein
MRRVGLEPTIPVFEGAKKFRAFDCEATVTVTLFMCAYIK